MAISVILLAQQTAEGQGPPGWYSWVMIGGLCLMFYLFLLRPQQRQERDRLRLISQIKKNDKIVNQGGIIGVIDTIKEREDEVLLKGGLRITKSSIVRVVSDRPSEPET